MKKERIVLKHSQGRFGTSQSLKFKVVIEVKTPEITAYEIGDVGTTFPQLADAI